MPATISRRDRSALRSDPAHRRQTADTTARTGDRPAAGAHRNADADAGAPPAATPGTAAPPLAICRSFGRQLVADPDHRDRSRPWRRRHGRRVAPEARRKGPHARDRAALEERDRSAARPSRPAHARRRPARPDRRAHRRSPTTTRRTSSSACTPTGRRAQAQAARRSSSRRSSPDEQTRDRHAGQRLPSSAAACATSSSCRGISRRRGTSISPPRSRPSSRSSCAARAAGRPAGRPRRASRARVGEHAGGAHRDGLPDQPRQTEAARRREFQNDFVAGAFEAIVRFRDSLAPQGGER